MRLDSSPSSRLPSQGASHFVGLVSGIPPKGIRRANVVQ